MKLRVLSVLVAVALLFASLAQAQIPRTISYQGYLTSTNGAATSSATLPMLFNIYSGLTGGAALHSETQNVTVSNGIFNVLLGTSTALILPFDAPYYLGVTVGTDAEMAPRRPLAASPYAIRAATASSADTLAASAIVPGAQIADASVSAAKLAASSCTDGQVLQYNASSTAWVCTTLAASSGGTVTNINTGPGLAGGPITSSGTVSLASSQLLPTTTCASGQIVKWNGSAWFCAAAGSPAFNAGATQVNAIGIIGSQDIPGDFPSIAVGADGLPVIAYMYGASLRVVKCANAACSRPSGVVNTLVDANGGYYSNSGSYTSITIGTDGLPVISYSGSGLRVAKCGDPACSANNVVTIVDATVGVGQYSSIVIGADGGPVIAYFDAANKALKVVKCYSYSKACEFRSIVTVDAGADAGPNCNSYMCTFASVPSGGQTGQYTSIAIGSDGLPIISYFDGANLRVAKCGNVLCSASNIISTVDSSFADNNKAYRGTYSSISIGSDGLPIISYYNSAYTFLSTVKCLSANCTCTTANGCYSYGGPPNFSASNIGQYSSIAMGTDGLPIIAYYNATNLALNIARCSTADCSGSISVNAVDTGNGGRNTSITIGTDGLPIIAYVTGTTAPIIRVVKCGNAACTPYYRRR
ncbi:MAG: hypothetical protein H7203_03510 [Rhizobacter sp.]|nr:hypothetical protein [Burkholderiales bacterium]